MADVIPFGDDPREARRVRRLKLIAFDDIQIRTEPHYLVKGIIPRVGLIVVWGPPKSGKSFWVFDLAMHIALEIDYRGRRVRGGPVVYCAFEGQAGFCDRVEAYRQKFLKDRSETAGAVPFYLSPASIDLVADAPELIAVIREQVEKPAAVVLDTLNRSLRGSESNDEDMAAYVRAADAIREAFDCAVIIVHHCGIDGTRPRGHTSLAGAADTQIAIRRDAAGNVTSTVELCKDGEEGGTTCSRLEVVDIGYDDDADVIRSCVIVPSEAEVLAPPERVTGAPKVALELLRKALDEAGEPPPAGSRFAGVSAVIPVNLWRTHCNTGTVAESDKPDSQRKAFVRASTRLQSLNLIGIWSDLVWIKSPKRTNRT